MQPRVMKNDHTRLGWAAKSEARQARWGVVDTMSVYPANGPRGWSNCTGLTFKYDTGHHVLYLTDNAALELVKGLLMSLVRRPIGMTVDDEFQAILRQCQAAVAAEEEEARQIVEAVRESVDSQINGKGV